MSTFRKGRSNAGNNTTYQFQSRHMSLQNELFNMCMPLLYSFKGNGLHYLTLALFDT